MYLRGHYAEDFSQAKNSNSDFVMYLEAQKINFDNFNASLDDALFINKLVHINTEAEDICYHLLSRKPCVSLDSFFCVKAVTIKILSCTVS